MDDSDAVATSGVGVSVDVGVLKFAVCSRTCPHGGVCVHTFFVVVKRRQGDGDGAGRGR